MLGWAGTSRGLPVTWVIAILPGSELQTPVQGYLSCCVGLCRTGLEWISTRCPLQAHLGKNLFSSYAWPTILSQSVKQHPSPGAECEPVIDSGINLAWQLAGAGAHSVVSDSLRLFGLLPTRRLCPGGSPGKNTRVGCHALLQEIFTTQESNPHFLCLLNW